MSNINVLDSSIFNLISAGEVVERPASVVKELVENAVDAGATDIKIEIENGGKTKIKVVDNGKGMSEDDLKLAFLPHATSKIKCKNDLNSIKTLGFRGEALASISAVSMVNVISKTKDDISSHAIDIKDGKISSCYETSGVQGTEITVQNLFYQTPARLKFLKKDKSEENEITGLVQSLILANPNVSFTYSANGKKIYQTQGNGLKNTIYSIFNREITMNFIDIENTFNNMTISGVISNPTFSKGNRSYQTTILNGRVITNKTIQTAVEKAYEPFLMKRNYPLYVININIPYDLFDVNVHPSKFDVRFCDNHQIFSFIYHSVSKTLMVYDSIKEVPQIEYVNDDNTIIAENVNNNEKNDKLSNDDFNESLKNTTFSSFFNNQKSYQANEDSGAFYRMIKNRLQTEDNNNLDSFCEKPVEKPQYIQHSIDEYGEIKEDGDSFNFNGKVIGQVFDTYILVEKGEFLYVIDQHAAHERILYDKLADSKNIYSQPLLIPYIYNANYVDYDLISNILPQLNLIGFDIQELSGMSFKVDAVPEAIVSIDLDKFFNMITHDFVKDNLKSNDIIKEKLMQTACKSAIKAGDSFSNQQLDVLIKSFQDAEKKPLQCPHGRPTVIKFSKLDFEKWFKRAL